MSDQCNPLADGCDALRHRLLPANTTNDTGAFDLNSLSPGQYRIDVTATNADNDLTGDNVTSTFSKTFTITRTVTGGPIIGLTNAIDQTDKADNRVGCLLSG